MDSFYFFRESLCLESHLVSGENTSISVVSEIFKYKVAKRLHLKIKMLLITVSMKLDYWQLNFPLPIYT